MMSFQRLKKTIIEIINLLRKAPKKDFYGFVLNGGSYPPTPEDAQSQYWKLDFLACFMISMANIKISFQNSLGLVWLPRNHSLGQNPKKVF